LPFFFVFGFIMADDSVPNVEGVAKLAQLVSNVERFVALDGCFDLAHHFFTPQIRTSVQEI